jgi:hypothetical protein
MLGLDDLCIDLWNQPTMVNALVVFYHIEEEACVSLIGIFRLSLITKGNITDALVNLTINTKLGTSTISKYMEHVLKNYNHVNVSN